MKRGRGRDFAFALVKMKAISELSHPGNTGRKLHAAIRSLSYAQSLRGFGERLRTFM
jgi:hypothetical protein